MAAATTQSVLLLFLFLSATGSSSTSAAPLDVSAALQRAKDVLSLEPFTEEEADAAEASLQEGSSSISLLLVPREAVFKTDVPDYESLVAARLRRDSVRLKKHLHGGSEQQQLDGVSAPLKSGLPDFLGPSYFARIQLGTPPQSFWLDLDTGSDINWVGCSPCSGCSNPVLDPFGSSSFSNLPCTSSECLALNLSGCRSDVCLYQMMSIGDNFTARIAIGCGHENPENDTTEPWMDGLLGLGLGDTSLTRQLNATSFSYCLVNRDTRDFSSIDFNATLPPDSVTTNLTVDEEGSYFIGASGLSVDGEMLPVQQSSLGEDYDYDIGEGGGVMVDSGTTVTYMPHKVYGLLRDAFVKAIPQLVPSSKLDWVSYDTCYQLSQRRRRRWGVRFPSVAFHFTNAQNWTLAANNVVIHVGRKMFCLAFQPHDYQHTLIGNIQMQGTRMTYDFANKIMGFSNDKC